jgi:1,2-phenylacetyl-CoA epoxidase catalytic subunit
MRREETYHLAHMHTWLHRLARPAGAEEPRRRLLAACERLWPDAVTVFTPPDGEEHLVAAGILGESLDACRQRWLAGLAPLFAELELPFPFRRTGRRLEPAFAEPTDGRRRRGDDFRWLWGEFTSVYRSEPGATW